MFILHCRLSFLFPLNILSFLFLFLLFLFNFLFLYTLPFIIFLVSGCRLIFLFVPILLYFIEQQNLYKFPLYLSPHLYSLTPISTYVPHDAVCPKLTKCTSFSGKGTGLFRFLKAFRPFVGATCPSVEWAIWSMSAGIKRPDREANHPPPSNAELNSECSHNFTPHMAFKARTRANSPVHICTKSVPSYYFPGHNLSITS